MSPRDLDKDFFCPLCRSNHFLLVTVKTVRTSEPRVVEGLYKCAGCSIVFADPKAFTVLMQDSIVNSAHYRERKPTREYPPDAETVKTFTWTAGKIDTPPPAEPDE